MSVTRGAAILLLGAWLAGCGSEREPVANIAAPDSPVSPVSGLHTVEFLSPVFWIDRKFPSMAGPRHEQTLQLMPSSSREILWIRGYRVTVVGSDGVTDVSQQFLCHNNLDYDPTSHAQIFGWAKHTTFFRMFTLSQGQFATELPEGYGIPVLSDESLTLRTQVLNRARTGS